METIENKSIKLISLVLVAFVCCVFTTSCEVEDYTYEAPVHLIISGATSVAANATRDYYTYYIDDLTYAWTVPDGATIQEGQGTAHIKVKFGTTGGILSVAAADMSAQIEVKIAK